MIKIDKTFYNEEYIRKIEPENYTSYFVKSDVSYNINITYIDNNKTEYLTYENEKIRDEVFNSITYLSL